MYAHRDAFRNKNKTNKNNEIRIISRQTLLIELLVVACASVCAYAVCHSIPQTHHMKTTGNSTK